MHLLVKYTPRTGLCTGSITIPRVFFSPVFPCVSAMQNPFFFLSWVPGGLTVVDRAFSVGYPCVWSSIIPCVLSYVFLRANLAYPRLLLTSFLCSLVFLPHKIPAFHHKLPACFPLFFLYNSPVLLFVSFTLAVCFLSWVPSCVLSTSVGLRAVFPVRSLCSLTFLVSSEIRSSCIPPFPADYLSFSSPMRSVFVFREFCLVFPLRFAVRNLRVSSSTS